MRVVFFGDLAGTGFGTVTQDLGPRLIDLGLDVRFVSENETGDLEEPFKSRTLDLSVATQWGGWRAGDNETAPLTGVFSGEAWGDGWKPEAGIILGDFFSAREVLNLPGNRELFSSIPMFHYVPIEGVGLPPSWADTWSVLRPIAMSEFGADQIAKVTGTRPPMIYHGVDTSVFYPVSPTRPIRLMEKTLRTKAQVRALLRIPERALVVFRADRNMPRKRYASLFRAMAPVMATRPNVILACHCRFERIDEGGLLTDEVSKYHPSIGSRIQGTGFHDLYGGAPRQWLNALYNAADLYVSTSAEGFGLTIAESLACGVPAVGIDYSSVPEVIGPAGRVVPSGLIDNEYDHFWAAVDEAKFGETVAELLDQTNVRQLLGTAGPRHVAANFDWNQKAIQWAGILTASRKEAVAA